MGRGLLELGREKVGSDVGSRRRVVRESIGEGRPGEVEDELVGSPAAAP